MTMSSGERTPLLIHSKPSNVVVHLGMTAKAVAFRRADRPARPVLLPVHSAQGLDGTGVAPRGAVFLLSQALLPPNAIQGGNGLRMTSASPSQPLRLLINLSLQTGMAMAGRRSVVPTSSRSLVLGHRWTRLLHN
jgi:hypothetical protein